MGRKDAQVKRLMQSADFFEMGGNSLTMARVKGELESVLEIEIPLNIFFQETVLSELANAVQNVLLEQYERT
jgi:acyl carrier protein